MLTTKNLYEKPGMAIDIGDKVIFELEKGLSIFTNEESRLKTINRLFQYLDQSVTATITSYQPRLGQDLEIEAQTDDGYNLKLNLSQCRNIRHIRDLDYIEE